MHLIFNFLVVFDGSFPQKKDIYEKLRDSSCNCYELDCVLHSEAEHKYISKYFLVRKILK